MNIEVSAPNTKQVLKAIAEKRLREPVVMQKWVPDLLSYEIKSSGKPRNDGEKLIIGLNVAKHLKNRIYLKLISRKKMLDAERNSFFDPEDSLIDGARKIGIPVNFVKEIKKEDKKQGGFYLSSERGFSTYFSVQRAEITSKRDIRAYITINEKELWNTHFHFYQLCARLLQEKMQISGKMLDLRNGGERRDNIVFYIPNAQMETVGKILLEYDEKHSISDNGEGIVGALRLKKDNSAIAWGYEQKSLDVAFPSMP